MTAVFHRISVGTKTAALALLLSLCVSGWASAELVTVTGSFGEYSGAVGNGTGIAGDLVFQSIMNGNNIAPIEPIPGLENSFIPPDPNDPNSMGQGIGRGVVPLDGAASVHFYNTFDNPSDGSTTYGVENLISFTPGPGANVEVGGEFLLGTFAFQNGEWWAAWPIHEFTFELITDSTNAALDGQVFSDTLILHITPNGGPPEAKADFFYFAGRPDLGSIRVLEIFDGNNYGTVDMYGKIGSLIPTRLANPTGGVFLDSSIDPIPPTTAPVPEPTTLAMLSSLALTVLGVGGVRKRRKATTAAA